MGQHQHTGRVQRILRQLDGSALEYCRITAAGAQKLFAQWDTVTVQGTAAQQAGMWTKLDGDLVVYDVLKTGCACG